MVENGPRHREKAQPPGRGSATEKGLRHGEEKTATEQGLIHRRGPQPPGKDSAAGRGPIRRGGNSPTLGSGTHPDSAIEIFNFFRCLFSVKSW